MKDFDFYEYLEKYCNKLGFQKQKIAELIGCSTSNYSNKIARKSFSLNEIFTISNFLKVDLNSIAEFVSLEKGIDEIFSNLKYNGYNNYYKNDYGFSKLEKLLNDNILFEKLDQRQKFELGYLTIQVAPNHNDYGIKDAERFINDLEYSRKKFDLNFVSGMLYGCFFNESKNYDVYCFPRYQYFPSILQYIFKSFSSKEISNIFRCVEQKTLISKNVELDIFTHSSSSKKYFDDNYKGREMGDVIEVIEKVVPKENLDKVSLYELEKFVLKLKYIEIIFHS